MDRLFAYFDHLKPGDRLLFACALGALVITFLLAVVQVSNRFLVETPLHGDALTEGFVGVPRFINPVLATTQLDKDLSALVYAGVMQIDAEGNLAYDLAEDVAINDEGTTYTITLAQNRMWSDGTPVTAEDVAFTIRTTQDAIVGSSLRAPFQHVSVEVVGTHEVVLTIPARDPGFLELLTIGILPAHIWSPIAPDRLSYSDYNLTPVGAGKFTLATRKTSIDGSPEVFVFVPQGVSTDAPRVNLHARFFPNDELRIGALLAGTIDMAASIDAASAARIQAASDVSLMTRTLPRTFGVFFNQKTAPALLDTAAREALDLLIDREALTHAVLGSYGESTSEPLPVAWKTGVDGLTPAEDKSIGLEAARARLERGDWEWHEDESLWAKKIAGATTTLSFTITTLNTPVFTETAAAFAARLAELGVPTKVIARERADMNSTIAAREYEMLLYGTAFGRARDLYPFWHSSRRVEPGLNVALYTNLSADTSLEHMRSATTTEAYGAAYESFMTAFRADTPALFLFSPYFIYAVRDDVTLELPARIVDQSERFALIQTWYKETERVWKIFAK
ncbi:hypothetical protein A3C87_01310 [Candidatus Kaiserbacteria bacterium RIFCSPHIGHO2_02_FULL_49_34]|uniref:Solute-binding protein family 5 domain-containing protein n=1 Tax=Candidatus Kaiserbacteria bacterium RIFCSPHIGHO2_02_FULL_49_34 TaxID=1798491 RepID=A0A1F6DLP1_9BACT|nr:MAG: hypothetical protein A3C87_01310 [Candidatus Kaiserbacteria bacterium RIFCSPHIGHO2_02_FULL_49_34]